MRKMVHKMAEDMKYPWKYGQTFIRTGRIIQIKYTIFIIIKHTIAENVPFIHQSHKYASIPVLPKLWDTELLCTEYARNYWLTRVPVDLSPRRLSVDRRQNYLGRILFNSSPRRLSVDRRWNYLARALVNLSPQRPSVDCRWNYLARVPGVYHSTDVETVDSHPNHLSLDRHNH